jgi:exopolysaccharide biosynthesis polyprenyl glycosylphosphotransferase
MSVVSLGTTSERGSVALVGTEQAVPPVDLRVVREPRLPGRFQGAPWVTGLASLVAGLVIAGSAASAGAGPAPAVVAVLCAVVVSARAQGRRRSLDTRDQLRADGRSALGLAAVVSLVGVVGLVPLTDTRWSLAAVLAATLATTSLPVLRRRPAEPRRVVLVGSAQDIESHLDSLGDAHVLVAGAYVADAASTLSVAPAWGFTTTTTVDTLDELVANVGADDVLVVPGRDTDPELVRRVTWALERSRATVGVVCPVSSVAGHRLRTTRFGDTTVLDLGVVRAPQVAQVAKQVIDRLGAAVLLLVCLPLLMVLMAAVRLDSKGPALFVQTRVGRDGQLFRMFKLRSMHRDAEAILATLAEQNESDEVLFKIRRDPRVTRVGSWLRRSSLDELPQLLNVLLGEMSLVGPRPALPSEVAAYDDLACRRLVVKPGITGLWQVSGRSDLQWEESLRLDLWYADNWTLVDDLLIAARTVSAVTRARGAY